MHDHYLGNISTSLIRDLRYLSKVSLKYIQISATEALTEAHVSVSLGVRDWVGHVAADVSEDGADGWGTLQLHRDGALPFLDTRNCSQLKVNSYLHGSIRTKTRTILHYTHTHTHTLSLSLSLLACYCTSL
jgi:hypothetical protein